VAARTPAVWDKALRLFPPDAPGLATQATVEAAFPAGLASAAAFGRRSALPSVLPREAVDATIRRAPRGSAPGLSGLRIQHILAVGGEGQGDVAAVVRLLTGEAAVRRVPPLAAHALAGANLLILCKPGRVDADGLPRLRPIGMPAVLRKLAAATLAGAVRSDAAALLSPLQQGVGVGNSCKRVLHELTAVLACRPTAALLQLDFKNAFCLVSLPATAAYLSHAFPLLRSYLASVHQGPDAPRVYGWAPGDAAGGEEGGRAPAPLPRVWLQAARGAQQGDPLGPLIHAAAMQLALLRLAAAYPSAVIRGLHDDVVVVAEPSELPAVPRSASAAGAAVDAKLAPAKCIGWSPAGAPAPAGWRAR